MFSILRLHPGLPGVVFKFGKQIAGLTLLACLFMPRSSLADELAIADDASVVLKTIGKPIGKFAYDDTEVWIYDRGTVEFLFGKVVAVDLLTQEQIQVRERRRRMLAEKKREEQRVARAQGEAEKRRILHDPQYKQLSANELTRIWDRFHRKYPDIPVDQPAYSAAVSESRRAKPQVKAKIAASDPGPPPKISGKRKRKLKRAGKWVWGDPPPTDSPTR